ncbi:MAG: RNA polymerase factor sigma-54 [Bacteroidia bacterium]
MLKQTLQQKLLQKLSPQQIQFIKLLQVPTAMLEQRIKEELEENPALEEADWEAQTLQDEYSDLDEAKTSEESDEYDDQLNEDIDVSEYLDADDTPEYKLEDNNYRNEEDERDYRPGITVDNSFHEQLMQQLNLLDLSDEEYMVGQQLVGSIDEDGYLRRPLLSIVDDLAFSQNIIIADELVYKMLERVQKFDPAGVGARDLRECLLLQLARKAERISARNAIRILEKYFEEYTKKHFDKIARSLNLDEEAMRDAHYEITHLNPRPGNAQADNSKVLQVIPDFVIYNEEGELQLRLNARNAPDLRISDTYREMFKHYDKAEKSDKKMKEAVSFVKQKLDAARWFIDAIRQRQHTLLSTMDAIMEHQYDFFLTGDQTKLKPMILKDIAEKVNLDISTISRVANSKYVQTEFGTFLLKSFFSEGIMTDSGEEASSKEVKQILTDLIGAEDKLKPLSDDKLAEVLNEKGYNIARRTVAKYREQLNIPVARLRKEL